LIFTVLIVQNNAKIILLQKVLINTSFPWIYGGINGKG